MYSNYLIHPQPSGPVMYHRLRHNSDPQLAPPFPNARRMSYGDYLSYTSDSSLETSPVGSTLDYYHHQQMPSPLAMHSELPSNNHKSCCPCIHSNGYYVDQLPAHRHPLDWQSPSGNHFASPTLQQQQQQDQFMMFDALPTPSIVSSQLMTPSLSSSSSSSQLHELSIYDLLDFVPTQQQQQYQQDAYCLSPSSPFVSHQSTATNDTDDQDDNKQNVNEANDKKNTKAPGGGKAKVKKSTRVKRNDVSGVTSNDRKKYKKTSSEPDVKQFLCEYDDCGKLFKRSEHLKRHVKSIHTKEKRKLTKLTIVQRNILILKSIAYSCPYKECGKNFARTDNLSQHIRIHRNNKGPTTIATKAKTRTKA